MQDERRDNFEMRVAVLLEALPYIRDFAGDTVVVKYGGSAMVTPELQASFARDIALLKLVGMNPVVVHGGGPAISRYSNRLGLEVRFVEGLRVTNEETMELAKMVLVGKVNKEIVAQLHVAGVRAVGLAGDDGRLIRAARQMPGGHDIGFVGRVVSVDPTVLHRLAEFVPVVASVGVDDEGQSYNLNADTVAGALAAALGARKVVFLTDVEGIFRDPDDPGSIVTQCTIAELEAMIEDGTITGGMLPKLGGVRDALANGVDAAQIVDGRVPHSVLLELFTEAGIGTKITR